MNSSMECSIKEQKVLAMKKYKRAKFVYNLVLYSITSIITCFFFSYPFWFPSMHHFLSSLPSIVNFSMFLNAKCFFVVGNLIVVILLGQSKIGQSSSSPTSDIYDEYLARSRMNGSIEKIKKHGKEEKIFHEEKKKEVRVCKSSMPHEEKKKGILRTSKSEVWGESGMLKRERTKGKKQERVCKSHEEKKIGMRNCKSAIWGESEIVKREKPYEIVKREKIKEKKEEEVNMKSGMIHEESKKMGMRSCKSEIWGGSEIEKREKTMEKKEEEEEICKSGMNHEENKKMGMRSCKSAVWDQSEIAKREKITKGKEDSMPSEELNKRVEAFIARVNKQRLLEVN